MPKSLIASDIIGKVTPPPGVGVYDQAAAAAGGSIGLLIFISNIIKVATVVAGIWVMFNFIQAGYLYVTSAGDTGAHKKIQEQLTMSIIGLVLIAISYTVAALLGLLIFGNAAYILNPTICGPGGCPP